MFYKKDNQNIYLVKNVKKSWLGVLLLVTFLSACATQQCPPTNTTKLTTVTTKTDSSRLDRVKQRGFLLCGVNGEVPGFSFLNKQGKYSGMDVDFCRAVAAALFDDSSKVEFRNLNSEERLSALTSGKVDLLSRNTTWTITRDISGVEFAPTIFYDGQGIMTPSNSGIRDLEDLSGKTICVKSGTTTELNLADRMSKLGIQYTEAVIGDEDTLYDSYTRGRCQAVTSDRSQLIARRSLLTNPRSHMIMPIVMSKEPLAPVVASGDSKWFDAVKWITYALIQAEELGINSSNLDKFMSSEDPSIKRFLGLEGSLGKDMGLPNDFAARIVKHVGNYGEIYSRNFDDTFHIDRGLNQLWTKGGLLYAPPFR